MRISLSRSNGIRQSLIFVALILLPATLILACAQPVPRDIQDRYYTSIDDTYRAADRVVTGLLKSEAVEEVDGQMLIYRTYMVTDSAKGSAREGDELHVATLADLSVSKVVSDEPFIFSVGDEYALFLKGRARSTAYPAKYGGTVWTLNGEPSVSILREDGSLEFAVSSPYREIAGVNEYLFSATWLDFVNLRK